MHLPMPLIDGFDIYRIPCNLGRFIGDNSCSYNQMLLLAICLKTTDGHRGWGYTEVMTTGQFTRTAWWIRPLPELPELTATFEKEWWPVLNGQNADHTENIRRTQVTSEVALDKAVRLALWDLMGQQAGLPLYKLLGGTGRANGKRSYGSPLDYPLTDEETTALVQNMLSMGFRTIKVKIGSPDAQRDIDRLTLIKSLAGPAITLTADANEAWTWQTALERLEQFDRAGIQLEYLEDPIYRTDLAGIHELATRSPIPIIGHDYLSTIDEITKLVDTGIQGIRTNKDFDYMIDCMTLAHQHNLPVYIGNSQFEVSIHAAIAFDQVDRIEFADLGWNTIVTQPVRIVDGIMLAPEVPGHGFVPKPEFLHA